MDPSSHHQEDRFSRLRAIDWWSQERLGAARVLVVGAGALGNEAIKNLALLGIGHLVIIDRDHIECSNLSRSVLFRAADTGQPKAEIAAREARDLYPAMRVTSLVGELQAVLGLGLVRWADVVIGALDNRRARVDLNRACARVGRPWIDGGIHATEGMVRSFQAPRHACYACIMSRQDWDALDQQQSCSGLARQAKAAGGTPTTPTMASMIGALQTQEAVKLLHGLDESLGQGLFISGLPLDAHRVSYPVNTRCLLHEGKPAPVERWSRAAEGTTGQDLWEFAEERLGELDELIFSRELVGDLRCPECGRVDPVWRPLAVVPESAAQCPACNLERVPDILHRLGSDSPHLAMTMSAFGLPPWDIVWARSKLTVLGIELAGEADRLLAAGEP